MHRKNCLTLSLLVRELLASFLCLPKCLKPDTVGNHVKNTHVHAPTHARPCARVHTCNVCTHAHLQAHPNARKHAALRKCAHSRQTHAHKPLCSQKHEHARKLMHTRTKHMHAFSPERTQHKCTHTRANTNKHVREHMHTQAHALLEYLQSH